MSENFEIECPCCEAKVIIDRQSGEVLWHKARERGPSESIEAMVAKMQSQKDEMAKKFDKGLASQKDRSRLLEEKFREAVNRAEKGGKPHVNPMDLD